MWVEPVATTKLLGYPHSPHQREFCTEGLFGRHALGMLGKTLVCVCRPRLSPLLLLSGVVVVYAAGVVVYAAGVAVHKLTADHWPISEQNA